MTNITYHKGNNKNDRASYVCGKAVLPAAMATRILKSMEGKPEAAATRIFIAKLSGRYDAFLDAMEKAGLSYAQAIREMKSLTPTRKTEGKPRIGKEVAAVAKMLCRKYSDKKAEEMLEDFLRTTSRPEFKAMVVGQIHEYETAYGRNAQRKIRVRPERKGAVAKDLVERAKKARAAKKAKK